MPLTFSYAIEPLHELLDELVKTRRAPVYVVHFTQKEAVERAQSLLSTPLASREQRDRIADEIADFRFGPGFGRTLNRLLRHGVGVHHAGMLPKYRRVVERLTQQGLLPVVCGTDTLGVGINVPIRTVLLTSLVKYDGVRMRHLSAREFHQISGRAGRAGFDTVGEVIILAPEHVIENRKLLEKAGDDPKKLKKIVRKKAPEGQVNWTDKTFERLRDAAARAADQQLRRVARHGAATCWPATGRPGRGDDRSCSPTTTSPSRRPGPARPPGDRRLPLAARRRRRRAAVARGPTARTAAAVRLDGRRCRRTSRSTRPCRRSRTRRSTCSTATTRRYAHDVVSVIEATLDDPRQVLVRAGEQGPRRGRRRDEGRGLRLRRAHGRCSRTSATRKPLAELLEAMFVTYRQTNPWVADLALSPKSVVRDMHERAMSFAEYVAFYQLDRTEGVLLRYLADAYRALRQTVPEDGAHRGARGSSSSGWATWSAAPTRACSTSGSACATPTRRARRGRARPDIDEDVPEPDHRQPAGVPRPGARRAVPPGRAGRARVLRRARAARRPRRRRRAWDADRWRTALDPYYDEHDEILTGPHARGPALLPGARARPRDVAGPAAARRPGGRPRLAHRRRRRPRGAATRRARSCSR